MNPYPRNGKIAHLPQPLRDELNHRLYAGETGRALTEWLNGLPEVQAAMKDHFDGTEIREQNLSEWKKGGYEDWLRHQEALEIVEHLYERAQETHAQAQGKGTDGSGAAAAGPERMPLNDVLSMWLTARFVRATRDQEAMEGEPAWRRQRQMCDDLMKMRRAEHRLAQLQLEREKMELHREEVQIERDRLALQKQLAESGLSPRGSRPPRRSPATNPAPAHHDHGQEASDATSNADPDRPWPEWSDEERIAWARRPENFERIEVLTDEDKAKRWKEILGIAT